MKVRAIVADNHSAVAVRLSVEPVDVSVKNSAMRQLALARRETSEFLLELRFDSVRSVRNAAESAQALVVDVRYNATQLMAPAKQSVPL